MSDDQDTDVIETHAAIALPSGNAGDDPETAARNALRAQLESDVEAFLKAGGSIETVETGFRADPPRKPEPKYGGGSI